MSGVSYARITYPTVRDNADEAKKLSHYLKEADGVNNHRFSLLYNAYVEQSFTKSFAHYRDSYYKTHADSGGLQIITQGAAVTDEVKRKIYQNQARYSDIAMSFDEIPLITVGGKSGRRDMNTRFFDVDGYKDKALQSARNLNEQIKVFKEEKSEAKPMLIIHGNNFENANEWANIILDHIPFEDHKYLGGIAMGGGSFGMAEKEMMLRTAVAANILRNHPDINQYVHFLGIGSVRLLYTAFCLRKNGWLKDVDISYDSTSHSSAPHMGRYLLKGCINKTYTRVFNQDYEQIRNDVMHRYPNLPYNLEEFHWLMTNSAGNVKKKYGSDMPIIEVYAACVMACVRNFMEEVERCDNDHDAFLRSYIEAAEWDKYKTLLECVDAQSYNAWDREFGSMVRSKKIATRPVSLMDFV